MDLHTECKTTWNAIKETGTYTLKQQLFFNQSKRPHPTTTTTDQLKKLGG